MKKKKKQRLSFLHSYLALAKTEPKIFGLNITGNSDLQQGQGQGVRAFNK